MQDQPQVQSVPPKQFPSKFDNPPPRSKGNKFILVVFGAFILLFTGAAGYLFGYQQGGSQQTNKHMVSKSAKMKVASSSARTVEVTKETKIAKSLTVPKLDPELHWANITKTASNDGIMASEAENLNNKTYYISVAFPKGKVYIATGAAALNPDFQLVDNYYMPLLKKLGWIIMKDNNSEYLLFHSFRLRGVIADNPCGGTTGYVGYKDGMIRDLSVTSSYAPCVLNRKVGTKIAITYTVFVSDPTPVGYFADYLKAHADITVSPSTLSTASGQKK
ncbi:MAG TPA: hypothetical protein VND99_01095 [Candidatus Acidoferrales bacterium]|nr:hypothetical protein [Candidatus Acidoferrales bacterium]